MSRRCGSSKPTPTPLTVWLWSQENATKSNRKKRRPYNKAIVTRQKPAACRRCGGGGRKGSRICLMPPVWRGGQERLYGKPTTEKVLWRGEPSSIWRGKQALTRGRSHAKNLPICFLTFPNIKRQPYHTKPIQMISTSDCYRPFEAVS